MFISANVQGARAAGALADAGAVPVPAGHLLRNCVLFGRLLRAVGVEVTPTQMVDLVESLRHVDIGRKPDFKYSAQAVLVNRRDHLPLFDEAFELFWQARTEDDLIELDLATLLQKQDMAKPEVEQATAKDGGEDGDDPPTEGDAEIEQVLTYSAKEILRQKDFSHLDENEIVQLKRLMLTMRWNLDERRTRRTVLSPRGSYFDMRRTIRQNLRHGGELLRLARRERKHKRRPVVVICDISGSMERYSRVLLQFIYAISNELDRVESFVFSTRLTPHHPRVAASGR